jgi:hypothetical protein
VGAAGFENAAKITETRENEAGSGSRVVVETPVGDRSCGPEADLAHAVRLAAEAGQWGGGRLVQAARRCTPGRRPMRLRLVRPGDQRRKDEARYTMGKKQKARADFHYPRGGPGMVELSAVA